MKFIYGRPARSRGAALALLLLLALSLIGAFLIFGGGYVAGRKLDARSYDRTAFSAIDAALARFVQVNKRLPCPANGGSGTSTDGVEDPSSGATDCSSPAGVVPWTTLGLPRSAATDSFGRLYSYRVYDGSNGFTRTNGLDLADCLDDDDTDVVALSGGACNATTHENTRSDFFCVTVSGGSCTAAKGLTVDDRGTSKTRIAYVLLSHGATGYGAFLPDPTVTMTAPTAGGRESTNASDSATYWILDESAGVAPDDASHFDDALSYRNVNDLAVAAKLGGRSWPIAARLDTANLDVNADFVGNILVAATGTAGLTSGNAMTISPAPSASRLICTADSTPQGITSCVVDLSGWSGTDRITTANDERLTFEFRIARRFLKVKLGDFRVSGVNYERAKFTFYNGATQVYEVVKSACENSATATARFGIDPGAEFTKVEVRADDSSISTALTVVGIAGCKLADSVSDGTNSIHCYLVTSAAAKDATGTNCP